VTNLTLQRDGEWTVLLKPTPEQIAELESATSERLDQISQSLRPVASATDAAAAQALYESHRIEGATLIACDIALPEGTGIINCRLGGEHRQIRF
jgi:hypothetical protein